MTEPKNIYISYSGSKNTDDNKADNWIENFIENLQISISRAFTISPGYIIKGKDFTIDNFASYIPKSDVFILIINEKYEEDTAFIEELNAISKQLELSNASNSIEGVSRIIKVYTNQLDKKDEPADLQDIIPYNFYKVNLFNRKTSTYNFDGEDALACWSKLLDLTYVIKEILIAGDTEKDNTKYVFLSETSLDQIANKDEIARELQYFGYRLLPLTTLPEQSEDIEKATITSLEHASLIVQIFGAQYGSLVSNGRYSLPDFQNQIIQEYLKNNPDKALRRIIWIPSGIRITDQRQNIFLNKLRRDDRKMNTELVESPIEVFKSVIQERVTSKISNSGDSQKLSLYLIYEEENENNIQEFANLIHNVGIELLTPDFDNQEKIYSNHLTYLKNADYILIFEGEKNLYWLKSKIRELIKAPGIGRLKPLNQITIVSERLIDSKDLGFISNKLEFIKPDTSSFQDYLNKIKQSHDNQ